MLRRSQHWCTPISRRKPVSEYHHCVHSRTGVTYAYGRGKKGAPNAGVRAESNQHHIHTYALAHAPIRFPSECPALRRCLRAARVHPSETTHTRACIHYDPIDNRMETHFGQMIDADANEHWQSWPELPLPLFGRFTRHRHFRTRPSHHRITCERMLINSRVWRRSFNCVRTRKPRSVCVCMSAGTIIINRNARAISRSRLHTICGMLLWRDDNAGVHRHQ